MGSASIKYITDADRVAWDNYLSGHPQSNVYQKYFWGESIKRAYGHDIYNLMAVDSAQKVVGVLPLVHIKHFLFGNKLFSMPFADLGGLLADSIEIEQLLIDEAMHIAEKRGIITVELRQSEPTDESVVVSHGNYHCTSAAANKLRMLLPLPESADELMASFKAKLRSQIRRPLKDGLLVRSGSLELLDDFYSVFAVNMRDLASPVHAKAFIRNIVENSSGAAKLFVVYKEQRPLACSLTLSGGNVLSNPWASSLRQFSRMSPNMLLYWAMLEYACEKGCRFFDFGRSTPGEGTYKFKKQWGAIEKPLNWRNYSKQESATQSVDQKSKFEAAMELWKRLPVPLTRILGPAVRKNIGL